ncbi:hypothetical protein [Neptunitalea lumnitzerae]|uniref:Uncharacterized protein n=1 Tax=Neptunitalea lumnitzerae TaxID=2965509 RepID=A0ABQ5MJI0_9FLAO|nr:hypothetical protein [Neptunitalea sp. Y10]GLB49533.1 hypothetical protein Y10_19010 [Neptunitalea sp. Y10]
MKIKHILILLILCIFCQFSFGQSANFRIADTFDILTKSENKKWLLNFSNVNEKSERISLIKQKIRSDADYRIKVETPEDYWEEEVLAEDFVRASKEKECQACDCKISFKLIIKSEEYDLNAAKYSYVYDVLDQMESDDIEKILVDYDINKKDMYTEGECGIVYLYTENKKLKRIIRKALKN